MKVIVDIGKGSFDNGEVSVKKDPKGVKAIISTDMPDRPVRIEELQNVEIEAFEFIRSQDLEWKIKRSDDWEISFRQNRSTGEINVVGVLYDSPGGDIIDSVYLNQNGKWLDHHRHDAPLPKDRLSLYLFCDF
jgi:hypothetical protein